jgi:hypothetical protein
VGTELCKKMLSLASEEAEKKRKKKLDEAAMPKQHKIFDFVNVKKPVSKFEKEKMKNAVENYIVGTNSSLATIEDPFFRKMLFTFNSG